MLTQRTSVMLSAQVSQCIKLGRLQMLARIPVIAGDSISGKVSGLIRLNNLRRPLAFDIRCDVFGFFVPWRYSYGNAVMQQIVRDQAFPDANPFTAIATTGHGTDYLLTRHSSIPRHIPNDYKAIWNHFFRDPSDDELPQDFIPDDYDSRHFGFRVGNLPAYHTMLARTDDAGANHTIDTSQATIRTRDLDLPRAEYRARQAQQYYGVRYEEVHKLLWSASAPAEIATVPDFLGRRTRWLSGHDIAGTAGPQLGEIVGKLIGGIRYNIPRRFYTEHGTIYVLCTLRPKAMYRHEIHRLDRIDNWNYMDAFAPPEAGLQEPQQITEPDLFADKSGNTVVGRLPAMSHFREHPNYSSSILDEEDKGWQSRATPAGGDTRYCSDYDDIFQTLSGGHGKVFVQNQFRAIRPIRPAVDSVMGGD